MALDEQPRSTPRSSDSEETPVSEPQEVAVVAEEIESEAKGPGAANLPLRLWSDEKLFAKLREGSEPHFNTLYDRYFQRIYSFVFLRVRNHADAEELTQETFTVVFRSSEGYSGRSTPLGWIYGIAKNTVFNHLRRNRLHGQRVEEAGPEPLVSNSATWSCNPQEHLEMDRYARAIEAQLGSISGWQAEAFVMRHMDNMTIQEISERTNRSGDAIRSGLYRVKRLLLEVGELESASSMM